MKIYDYTYNNISPDEIISSFADTKDVLFIDIETTGLSPANSIIYLIGVGYFNDSCFNVRQWFAETPLDEENVLKYFLDFCTSYTHLLHFNGDKFDIPFIEKRAQKYKINNCFTSIISIDIYKKIKPLKKLLGLQDLRQKTIEAFLGINRDDLYSGGELISVYKKYTMRPDDSLLKLLLLHNEEDVLNMPRLIPILSYTKVCNINSYYVNHTLNKYTDYNGNECQEILVIYKHSISLPSDIKSNNNGIYVNLLNSGKLILRLPVYEKELKLFFEDTNNYYYLPDEDMCIHKSVAAAVDKEHRKKATKATCYVRKTDKFVPNYSNYSDLHIFKTDYKSKDKYIALSEFIDKDADYFQQYLSEYLLSLVM